MLMGRSELSGNAKNIISELTAQGVDMQTFQGDVSRVEDVEAVLNTIDTKMPSLKGILHSAGLISDALVVNQSWDKYAQLFAPKVLGTWHLHQLTKDKELDYFITFSSLAALFGSPGQSNHSAANAFMDALMIQRRALGLPGISINWGAWSKVGYAAREGADERLAAGFIDAVSPSYGLKAFETIMRSPDMIEVGVTPIRWHDFMKQQINIVSWAKAIEIEFKKTAKEGEKRVLLVEDLAHVEPGETRDYIQDHVNDIVVDILKLNDKSGLTDKNFFDMGMDSLMTVELRNRLQASMGKDYSLSSTLIFDFPNITELTEHILNQLGLNDAIEGSEKIEEQEQKEKDQAIDQAVDEMSIDDIRKQLEDVRKRGGNDQ